MRISIAIVFPKCQPIIRLLVILVNMYNIYHSSY
jgi:hypothetical protein